MITTNIISRTFHVSVNNDFGSCFTMEHKENQFIVTAKHVLESLSYENGDEIEIKIFHNNQWKTLRCNVYEHIDSEIDISVLKTTQVNFPRLSVNIAEGGYIYGGDVFFLGFPYGMFSKDLTGEINQKFPIPFVKKGVLSAIINEYDITTLYIDAHNNSGFSGGPVITVNPINKDVSIIGVNVSYMKHDNSIEVDEQDEDGYLFKKQFDYHENSGIMEAHSIRHVIEIIEGIIK